MWFDIIGGGLIALGAVSLAKPDILRKKLQKKGIRTLRRCLFAVAFALGALLMSAGWGHEGALPKVMTGIGFVLILKGAYLAKAKSADVIADRLAQLPPLYIRLFALAQIVAGCLMIFGLKE